MLKVFFFVSLKNRRKKNQTCRGKLYLTKLHPLSKSAPNLPSTMISFKSNKEIVWILKIQIIHFNDPPPSFVHIYIHFFRVVRRFNFSIHSFLLEWIKGWEELACWSNKLKSSFISYRKRLPSRTWSLGLRPLPIYRLPK